MNHLHDYLKDLADYNIWANKIIAEFVDLAGEETCSVIQNSSFPTVRETILHIWDAQYIWILRLEGKSFSSWPGKDFDGSTSDAAAGLVGSSLEWRKYIGSINEGHLNTSVEYRNIKGVPFANTVQEIAAHVMNHGTYHRGQVVTMLRGAGFTDLRSTDMINFLRSR